MAKTKSKKLGIFNFTNWPDQVVKPSLSEHSASVVDAFIQSLDPDSRARVVCLEVAPDAIVLLRRKRKPRVDEQFIVTFDLYGSRTTENVVAAVLSKSAYRDFLREMVEAAVGRPVFNAASAGNLISRCAFATGLFS